MRRIKLKTLGDLKTAELLAQIAKQPLGSVANGGTVIENMRHDIRILDVLETADGSDYIDLEDADWAHLTTKLRVFPFGVADRRILEICEDTFNAENLNAV